MRRKRNRAGRRALAAAAAACAVLAPLGLEPGPAGADLGPTSPTTLATPPGQLQLTTPVLSVRRVAAWVENTAAAQKFAPVVSAFAANPALTAPGVQACVEVAQGGQILGQSGSAAQLLPASNMKILTATAALDKLGPAFRYTTTVKADTPPVGGILTGNLYLIGGGDPLLRTPDFVATLKPPEGLYTSLAQLAAQVKAAGIIEVKGAVLGDESRYDTLRSVPTWKPEYQQEEDAGSLSALEVNDGFQLAPVEAPAPQPAVQASQEFVAALAAAGVKVDGPAAAAATPPSAVPVTAIQSAPLNQAVDAILTTSDDTGAELLTKELGYEFGGAGSTAAGTAVIKADLTADGLPTAQFVNADGSGLDRADRVTCPLMVAALAHDGGGGAVADGLPVAGVTGTLAKRMIGTPAAGRLKAKTGTLDDVSALSGFVFAAAGAPPAPTAELSQPLVFSLIINGVTDSTGVTLGDQLGVTLAGYASALPPMSVIAPQAPVPPP